MSLVANYTDSEDEEDSDQLISNAHVSDISKFETITNTAIATATPGVVKSKTKKALNLFGVGLGVTGEEEDDAEDDSDSDSSDSEVEDKVKPQRSNDIPLDNPFRYFGSGGVSASDSVLRVEFREQDAQQKAIMERHVKMTDTAGAAQTINGKNICWRHRKNLKCRFGHNCKFAHDSDILGAIAKPDTPAKNFQPITDDDIPSQFKKKNPFSMDNYDWDNASPAAAILSSSARLSGSASAGLKKKADDGSSDDEKEKGNDHGSGRPGGRKKRPGLSMDIVPGKKVMNLYYKSKQKAKVESSDEEEDGKKKISAGGKK